MGDILHSLPAITALRRAHPGWHIGWAVEPQWVPLFRAENASPGTQGMPLVDALHIVPAKRWGKAPFSLQTLREIRAVRREVRAAKYDVALDLQGAVRSALVARSAKPHRLLGEDEPREPLARLFFSQHVATRGVHVIEQSIEVVEALAGQTLPSLPPLLPSDHASTAYAVPLPKPLVLVSPGAGWGAKRWPADRYGEVAQSLTEQGYRVAINAGPAELHLAQQISAVCPTAIPLTPSLSQLTAVTRRAALVIAGDTGPLHLACALGRPVVGIFGPTDPARNGPYGVPFRVLRHPDSKRDHTRHAAPEAGLLTITPDEVTTAALELLSEAKEASL
jgi:heptosyltransferase I